LKKGAGEFVQIVGAEEGQIEFVKLSFQGTSDIVRIDQSSILIACIRDRAVQLPPST
jgi:hypothetical protein